MGRTNATYRNFVRQIQQDWNPYRRALRFEDQQTFDDLFEHVSNHADAGSNLNATDPVVPVFLSIILEQEKRIQQLEDQLDDESDE